VFCPFSSPLLAAVKADPGLALQNGTDSIADETSLPMAGSIGKQPICVNVTLHWFIPIALDNAFRVQFQ
jgi:hypothetical protein